MKNRRIVDLLPAPAAIAVLLGALAAAPAFAEGWHAGDAGVSVRVRQAEPFPADAQERSRWAQERGWPVDPRALERTPRAHWADEREQRGYGRVDAIDLRQERQRQRIAGGWRAGELSRGEMRDLLAEQRAIEAKQRGYLADGHLSRWEYADLARDLDSAARRIYHAKHDGDWRGGRD